MPITGKFKDGLTITGTKHMDFELREPNTGDMLDAEGELASDAVYKPLTFSAALAAVTLVRIGSFTGPFTSGLLRSLSRRDFAALREKLSEEEQAGNVESDATGSS